VISAHDITRGTITSHHVRDEAGDLWGFQTGASGVGWRCTECVHPSHNGGVGDVVHLGKFRHDMPKPSVLQDPEQPAEGGMQERRNS
jgi:hypothetical protein